MEPHSSTAERDAQTLKRAIEMNPICGEPPPMKKGRKSTARVSPLSPLPMQKGMHYPGTPTEPEYTPTTPDVCSHLSQPTACLVPVEAIREHHGVDDPTLIDNEKGQAQEDDLSRQIVNTNGHQGGAVQSEQEVVFAPGLASKEAQHDAAVEKFGAVLERSPTECSTVITYYSPHTLLPEELDDLTTPVWLPLMGVFYR